MVCSLKMVVAVCLVSGTTAEKLAKGILASSAESPESNARTMQWCNIWHISRESCAFWFSLFYFQNLLS